MANKIRIRWGIIGLGNIADLFMKDLLLVEQAEIYAVASRSESKAKEVAKRFGATKAYSNYKDIMKDPDVDIIYVATPHNSHKDLSVQALNNNKHVLCEKPLALNKAEAEEMIDASTKNNKFFMEALWSRFNPSIMQVLQKVEDGEIGDVKYINADFAFKLDTSKIKRLEDISLGGGSLLDMGIYPVFLAYLLLGKPKSILASANFYEGGADKQTSMIFHYDNAQAVLHSSFISQSNMIATISGEKGRINIHDTWHVAQSYSITVDDNEVEFNHPTLGTGFTYEIMECHNCILNSKIESEKWSHQNSLDLIEIMDEVRKNTGLRYPGEKI